MTDLERFGEFILDNKKGSIINHDTLSGFRFNFDKMMYHPGNRSSQPKPIRYDADLNKVLYWSNQRWNVFNEVLDSAVNRLFHNYCERKILE